MESAKLTVGETSGPWNPEKRGGRVVKFFSPPWEVLWVLRSAMSPANQMERNPKSGKNGGVVFGGRHHQKTISWGIKLSLPGALWVGGGEGG